ncbi:hypothetical protein GCM10017673_48090 [Streptosporangium violaceochromogenes]|nr:hypothetical protein GCM10017673_48090 [Streptosporangium violaceochromogenes]
MSQVNRVRSTGGADGAAPAKRVNRAGRADRAPGGAGKARGGVLGFHLGFGAGAEVPESLRGEACATWVDLDAVPGGEPVTEGEWGEVLLVARTPADLRRAVPYGAMLPRAPRVTVIVMESPPWRLPPVPVVDGARFWRSLLDVRVRRGERASRPGDPSGHSWRAEVRFGRPAPAGGVLRALCRGLGGLAREPLTVPVVSLSGAGSCRWRPGDPNATPAPPAGPVPARRDAPGCDLSLRTAGPGAPAWRAEDGAPLIERPEPGRPGAVPTPGRLLPVDELSVCPIGFVPADDGPLGRLIEESGGYEVRAGDGVVARLPLSGALTDVDVARLRGLAGVAVDLRDGGTAWTAPAGVAHAVCGLAAAGVPVIAEPGTAWHGPLGPELAALLGRSATVDLSDALAREEFSIRLRRHALTLHGVAGRWRDLAASRGLRPAPAPTVSVLLCTRRPDMVGFALEQVGRQRGPEVEVLLTLHGFSADRPEVAAAVSACERDVTVIEADARTVFGDALNRAAERARGAYLTKMDDDDWYGPGHLSDLLLARRYSSADLVGAAPEFVYLERIGVTVHRSLATETYTDVVAGGTMLMTRAAFDNAGGFRPIPRTVDGQLLEAVAAAGGRIYRTHGFNYILRRRQAGGHTWQEPINGFLRSFRRQWRGFHANPLMETAGPAGAGEPAGGPVGGRVTG